MPSSLLVLSLPLAIAAETIAMYAVSLMQISIIWPAWVLIAIAFAFFSLAVDERCYVDLFYDALFKFRKFFNRPPITDSHMVGKYGRMEKYGIVSRGTLTLIAIAAVCTAVKLAAAFGDKRISPLP